MSIKKILSEISKTLKELTQIQKERLELERKIEKKDIDDMKIHGAFQDRITEKIGKDEQMQEQMKKELFKIFGIKEQIDLEEIELGDDLNK